MLMLGACLSVNPLTGKAIDLRVEGVHNTVLGHDNCEHGSRSTDDTFVYIDHGAVRIGNFNLSGTSLNFSQTLQVEGPGYIRSLSHGLPSQRVALSKAGVAAGLGAVDDEPVLLQSSAEADSFLRVGPLRLSDTTATGASGAYFEVTVAGVGLGGDCSELAPADDHDHDDDDDDDDECVYSARFLATPYQTRSGKAKLSVEVLASSAAVGKPVVVADAATGPGLAIPLLGNAAQKGAPPASKLWNACDHLAYPPAREQEAQSQICSRAASFVTDHTRRFCLAATHRGAGGRPPSWPQHAC
jgi:hypothetical protein